MKSDAFAFISMLVIASHAKIISSNIDSATTQLQKRQVKPNFKLLLGKIKGSKKTGTPEKKSRLVLLKKLKPKKPGLVKDPNQKSNPKPLKKSSFFNKSSPRRLSVRSRAPTPTP
ncbi:hypothetical protein BATDEDRAFT_88209 [Batrachochytrium dendrobatidis JAM81]|uniref:Uncharacterized protein n=2 Tax=Batrachochytrium dendrobatidis TaxID=109871 RepID=F4P1C5_BATDJ|nr:uncharacterized protein BATDEDRAFT_88209 [Batrachochytrium dendrobatidis JAM81]EGF80977.1 hypothetical protein BATDEDRAFT_88209 [Batrachochytrium dendrobatidis JAM81]KAJ8328912.1 hypothetical protein O5D80_002877 [Batrachochytrium dendrobatidis]KAK5668859.1 hypothetical protein QVD99_004639 [Batrachochytrium dendrobatidis]|eukprot:XP_006678770.1 hypothetical protein BATDEDRAFT_88209 [Batrachochytrium dendrobatidis JAM81]